MGRHCGKLDRPGHPKGLEKSGVDSCSVGRESLQGSKLENRRWSIEARGSSKACVK